MQQKSLSAILYST